MEKDRKKKRKKNPPRVKCHLRPPLLMTFYSLSLSLFYKWVGNQATYQPFCLSWSRSNKWQRRLMWRWDCEKGVAAGVGAGGGVWGRGMRAQKGSLAQEINKALRWAASLSSFWHAHCAPLCLPDIFFCYFVMRCLLAFRTWASRSRIGELAWDLLLERIQFSMSTCRISQYLSLCSSPFLCGSHPSTWSLRGSLISMSSLCRSHGSEWSHSVDLVYLIDPYRFLISRC